MVGKHSGLMSHVPAGAAQWLAASVTEVHHACVLYQRKRIKHVNYMRKLLLLDAFLEPTWDNICLKKIKSDTYKIHGRMLSVYVKLDFLFLCYSLRYRNTGSMCSMLLICILCVIESQQLFLDKFSYLFLMSVLHLHTFSEWPEQTFSTFLLLSWSQLAHWTVSSLSALLSTRNFSSLSSGGSALFPFTMDGYLRQRTQV